MAGWHAPRLPRSLGRCGVLPGHVDAAHAPPQSCSDRRTAIWIQVDGCELPGAGHCDELLGRDRFLNEMCGGARRPGATSTLGQFGRTLDTIIVYGASARAASCRPNAWSRCLAVRRAVTRTPVAGHVAPPRRLHRRSVARIEAEGRSTVRRQAAWPSNIARRGRRRAGSDAVEPVEACGRTFPASPRRS